MKEKAFNIEDYQKRNTYAMHCETPEEAIDFLEYLDSVGKKWCSGGRYVGSDTLWERYKESTCYEFVEGTYGSLDYFIRNNYQVLEFKDFKLGTGIDVDEKDVALLNEFICGFAKK